MAGIHRDIRQYFKHSISGTEKKEIPEGATNQNSETSQQSQSNEHTNIKNNSSHKTNLTKPKHITVHARSNATKRTKKARCFIKSTNVVNQSNYKLIQQEEKLLNKGLNFIPTPPREHQSHILQDYLLFDRKLRLKYYFIDKPDSIPQEDNIFKSSSGWTPPAAQDQNFDNYRKLTQQEIMTELNISPNYKRFNLTKKERKAIKSLAQNTDIVIKLADKRRSHSYTG